jgi:O-antigen ligase
MKTGISDTRVYPIITAGSSIYQQAHRPGWFVTGINGPYEKFDREYPPNPTLKELFPGGDRLANKISYYHLLLLIASLPFDMFYSHIILLSFALHTIIQAGRYHRPVFKWRTLVLLSVFIVTAFSTIYTTNRPAAFSEWGKELTILLFPLLFCFTRVDLNKYRPALLLGFSLVCTATVIYLYGNALYTIRFYHMPLPALFSRAFTNHNFAQPIDMHATFFSMQLAIALVYLTSVLVNSNSVYNKILYSFCVFVLAAGLLQLCSKSVFFGLLAAIGLALPYFLLRGRRRWKFVLIALAALLTCMVIVFNVKTLRARYITELAIDLSKPFGGETTEPRLARWEIAGELIAKSPVIGYGAGSEIGLLHEVYFQKKYYSSFLNNLNVHSEYLSFLLKSGVVGLLVYLITLAWGFREALLKRDLIFFAFMLLLAFVSFAENFLDVDKGIIFYAFFFSFFVFSNEARSPQLLAAEGNQSGVQPVIKL